MLKKTPVDWLLSRLSRSRNARRKSLSFRHDRQGAAPHVPSVVQELEDRLVLTAPTITSLAAASAAENFSGVILTVTATDPEVPATETLAYSKAGGADQGAFSIDSSTGELTFADFRSIDFENPTDTGGTPGDNIYEVIVAASDGTDTVMQTVNVTVTDVSIGTRTVTLPDGGGNYSVIQSGGNIAVMDASFNRLSDDQPNDFTTLVIQGSNLLQNHSPKYAGL